MDLNQATEHQVIRVDELAVQILQSMGLYRNDAGETAAFARSLEFIYAQTYDKIYPDYKARQLIPLNTSVPAGAEQHTFRQMDRKGEAMIIRDYGRDFPNVEIQGLEVRLPVVSIGASYAYSIQDVRASALMNLPLEARKALFTRQVMEQKLDQLAAWGDVNTGLTGLANAANILNGASTASGGTSTATANWVTSSATVTNILNDVNILSQKVFNASLGAFMPDTMILPTPVFSALATMQAITTGGIFLELSVLDYIKKTSPWIKDILHWPALDRAASGGQNSSHDRVLLMKRDPMVAELVIPQDFEQMPPELHGMKFQVPCHMRVGGVKVPYPFGVVYYDGANG